MSLIDGATKGEVVPRNQGNIYTEHSVYRVEVSEAKEPQNKKKASKSKISMCVPPLVKQRPHQ